MDADQGRLKPLCLLDDAIDLAIGQRQQLSARFEVHSWQASPIARRQQATALLLHQRLDAAHRAELVCCRYIGIRAHNTDYVPAALRDPTLTVNGIPQCGAPAVAEHTMALMLALAKQLQPLHQQLIAGHWPKPAPFTLQLAGKTLGLIGFGAIGQQVARIATALGMRVQIAALRDCRAADRVPLEPMLAQADVVSLHAASAAGLLLTRERLALMKPSALLINTARGALVDYQALGDMLLAGELGGLGLDVYPTEPPALDWLNHPRVLCSPHNAYATPETLDAMNAALITALLDWQRHAS